MPTSLRFTGCVLIIAALLMPHATHAAGRTVTFSLYAKNVGDSFSVFVQVPEEDSAGAARHYPVVYLLDANFLFSMGSAALATYSAFGMAQHVILVGIGYKDATLMDSLRCRDYTYPVALKKYEMGASGGAMQFLAFMEDELIPLVDSRYKTDTAQRVLFGHSLGGYFTLFTLWAHAQRGVHLFRHFIAASPSLDYDNNYLLNKLKQLHAVKNTSAYVTFGSLEDAEDADEPNALTVAQTAARVPLLLQAAGVRTKVTVFSNLQHMDMPMPTLTKGLQWCLGSK